ncbi:MAG: hypothetical protein PWQ70_2250 [Clostridiales bacterium]|nr:hypothetical protein [Clostridiales bacterium]
MYVRRVKKQDEKEFDRIREYLYQYPGANLYEVATHLDISVNTIKRYLREHRLEIIEKENKFLNCERCGQPIQSGRFCDDCVGKLAHEFKVAFKGKEPAEHKAKFHYVPYSR